MKKRLIITGFILFTITFIRVFGQNNPSNFIKNISGYYTDNKTGEVVCIGNFD